MIKETQRCFVVKQQYAKNDVQPHHYEMAHVMFIKWLLLTYMSYLVSSWVELTTFSGKYLQEIKENKVTLSYSFFFFFCALIHF